MNEATAVSSETNIILISDSGKPIFALLGATDEIARLCGLFQALRTSILHSQGIGLGDIQSLRTSTMLIVFMTVQALTLVAISMNCSNGTVLETEAFLKLQLEYAYIHVLSSLTDQVHVMLHRNPSLDLASVMGAATEGALKATLNKINKNPAPFLTGGVQPFFPMASTVREKTSRVLQSVGDSTKDTVFALLLVHDELVSLVQSSYRPHQLRVSDLHVLVGILTRQHGIYADELWIPIGFPRLNSSGFLYCYTNCFDAETKTLLVLVSQMGTTEQFQAFQSASAAIRRDLGLKSTAASVLEILNSSSYETGSANDIRWRRTEEVFTDDDYVDASGDGDRMIPYVGNRPEDSFVSEIRGTLNSSKRDSLLQDYLNISCALHFVFRLDSPIMHRKTKVGYVPQTMVSNFQFPLGDAVSTRRIWSAYQKLQLRLRLGSATVDATLDAFNMISKDQAPEKGGVSAGIGRHCPSVCLVESPPNIQSVSYMVDGTEMFLAMNGRDFEL